MFILAQGVILDKHLDRSNLRHILSSKLEFIVSSAGCFNCQQISTIYYQFPRFTRKWDKIPLQKINKNRM